MDTDKISVGCEAHLYVFPCQLKLLQFLRGTKNLPNTETKVTHFSSFDFEQITWVKIYGIDLLTHLVRLWGTITWVKI